jgi:hypothetical protein
MHYYREPLVFRILVAIGGLIAAVVSPIGGILGLHTLPPRGALSELLPGAVVGFVLSGFFVYLSVRAFRFAIVLTEDEVRLRGLLWTTVVPLKSIDSILEFIEETGDSGPYTVYAAKDANGNCLFRVWPTPGRSDLLERLHAVRQKTAAVGIFADPRSDASAT